METQLLLSTSTTLANQYIVLGPGPNIPNTLQLSVTVNNVSGQSGTFSLYQNNSTIINNPTPIQINIPMSANGPTTSNTFIIEPGNELVLLCTVGNCAVSLYTAKAPATLTAASFIDQNSNVYATEASPSAFGTGSSAPVSQTASQQLSEANAQIQALSSTAASIPGPIGPQGQQGSPGVPGIAGPSGLGSEVADGNYIFSSINVSAGQITKISSGNQLLSSQSLDTSSVEAALTITAAQMLSGFFTDSATQTASFNITTDTASNIYLAAPGSVGASFRFRIFNNDQSTTGYSFTLEGGTGVTISTTLPNPAVPKGSWCDYLAIFTAIGSAPAITISAVGMGTF